MSYEGFSYLKLYTEGYRFLLALYSQYFIFVLLKRIFLIKLHIKVNIYKQFVIFRRYTWSTCLQNISQIIVSKTRLFHTFSLMFLIEKFFHICMWYQICKTFTVQLQLISYTFSNPDFYKSLNCFLCVI